MPRFGALVLTFALLSASCGVAAGLSLVEDGRPAAVIVVADDATPIACYAAEELQAHITLATGARLEIVRESAADPAATLALVGPGRFTREMGLDVDGLAPEGYILRATEKRLALLGRDRDAPGGNRTASDPLNMRSQPGTLWAVYDFLETELGARWLWPGEGGTSVPRRQSIHVDGLDRSGAPALIQRTIRNMLDGRETRSVAASMGVEEKARAAKAREWTAWARRHRLGITEPVQAGHAFTKWYELYSKDHPEWFAMRPDGGRYVMSESEKERIKLCVSNPEVVEAIFQQGIRTLEANPHFRSFSVCPNDSHGYCMCPKCRAMDNPQAPPFTYRYRLRDGRDITEEYVTLSDRYARVWNQIAERLEKVHPDKFIFAYAYNTYREPPLREKLRSNIIIGFVGLNPAFPEDDARDMALWKGWAATGCRLYLRPNFLSFGHGYPFIYVRRMAADFAECSRNGMVGTDFDTCHGHYSTQGLSYYALARLHNNPEMDGETIIDEYCQAGFGPAAPAVKDYFTLCERLTERAPEIRQFTVRSDEYIHFARIFDDAFLQEARGHLARAKEMAGDDAIRARIDFLETGLRYVELSNVAALSASAEGGRGGNQAAVLKMAAERERFLREKTLDWSVNAVNIRTMERHKKITGVYGVDLYETVGDKDLIALLDRWRFKTDPENVGEREGWMAPDFGDKDWPGISAGRFWEVQGHGGGARKNEIAGGYDGVAWYRTSVVIPENYRGRRVILNFGGIDESGWVYVNGKKVGEIVYHPEQNPQSYRTPLACDITSAIAFGKRARIAVKVEDRNGAGGLWRLVSLYAE